MTILRRRQTEEARQHLEQSQADRPAVEALAADLAQQQVPRIRPPDRLTARVDPTLRGRRP